MDGEHMIVTTLDGSVLAEHVLPSVQLLAHALKANVRLLHVTCAADTESMIIARLVPLEGTNGQRVAYPELQQRANTLLREHIEQYLESRAVTLRATGLEVDIEVRAGAAPTEIVAAADAPNAMIALVTHGFGGWKRWALGSVTDQVVQTTSNPILVVPGNQDESARPRAFDRILVPLDGSAFAKEALPLALELAIGAQAELTLLHVVDLIIQPPGPLIVMRNLAETMLKEIACQLTDRVQVTTVVSVGRTAETIVNEIARRDSGLVVMATHGLSGFPRWALGSIADQVLRTTSTPLLLVRPPSLVPRKA